MVYKWINYIQSTLFPPICLLCGAEGDGELDLCTGCRGDLPYLNSCCSRCALPLPTGHYTAPVCGSCLQDPPAFDNTHIPFTYYDPLSYLIGSFKFSGKLQHGRLLSDLFLLWMQENDIPKPDMIIPVPLHHSRLRERGFNQALELAKPIARSLDIPISTSICRRDRATDTQSSLKKKERRKNIHGAFTITGEIDCEHLVLLDDVVTTGSTVAELSRLLKKAGAQQVDIWALARTL